jgi:hypothetical protein
MKIPLLRISTVLTRITGVPDGRTPPQDWPERPIFVSSLL